MEQLVALEFAETWKELHRFIDLTSEAPHPGQSVMSSMEIIELRNLTARLRKLCEQVHPDVAFHKMLDLELAVGDARLHHYDEFGRLLVNVEDAIRQDFHRRAYVQIREKNRGLYEIPINVFGADLYQKFETARMDIKEAGNCLALELNTAAVFHLMRIIEYGLRAIASALRVKTEKPIESCDWGQLIRATRNHIQTRRKEFGNGSKPKKGEKDALNAYETLIDHANVFRFYWRNNTMHSRSVYSNKEAEGVYDQVKEFMDRLAQQLSK
ncbi:MAG TPA: hypothetical protein VFC44_18975 [Candidatus Saccharimonadales bacterium]|nr:hypothetical protein [Candidatus Saccharimonadales bacterium]